MEAVYFTVVAVVLYFVADRILNAIEVKLGRRLEHRTLVFFGMLLAMALGAFALIRSVLGP